MDEEKYLIIVDEQMSVIENGIDDDQSEYVIAETEDFLKNNEIVGPITRSVILPSELGQADLVLYGPCEGDSQVRDSDLSICYATRKGCSYPSRIIDKPVRKTRRITISVAPDENGTMVLRNMYGGSVRPIEPYDPAILESTDKKAIAWSREFWSGHALAKDAFEYEGVVEAPLSCLQMSPLED